MVSGAQTIVKPAKMAKNCTACRSSKVRCALDDESGKCSRCVRLGLECIFVQSKRGQGCVKRDQARLGPVVRALLRATVGGDDPDGAAIQAELEKTKGADEEEFCWRGSECQRSMVQSISNSDGQLALLKHWLLIGVRSGSCGLLGNVLLLAHSCGVCLDDMNLTIARPLPPVAPVELPPFILEWHESASRLCCVRSQVRGAISWRPNATFIREVGDVASLRAQLSAAQPDQLALEVDDLICGAEMFLAASIHPDDRKALARLNGMLWSTLAPSDARQPATGGVRVAEATAPVAVRCLVRRDAGAAAYQPCTLSGRTVVTADSHAVHSVFSIVPLSAAADAPFPALVAQPVDPPVHSLPVGLAQWPVGDATAQLIATAQAIAESVDGHDLLAELGLDLAPDDAVSMIVAAANGHGRNY